MVRIVFLQSDGAMQAVDVEAGWSLMEAAVFNGVPNMLGSCGGACACATCQVYVPEASQALTGARTDAEAAMLEYAGGVRASSRLACQIKVTEAMNGMAIQVPGPTI